MPAAVNSTSRALFPVQNSFSVVVYGDFIKKKKKDDGSIGANHFRE